MPTDTTSTSGPFLTRCLSLDLETTRDSTIRRIGAVYQGRVFERKGRFALSRALAELDVFAHEAEFVLGHNLLGHDLAVLDAHAPGLGLLRKPAVDTLFLSPLAFPRNPYHPLIKSYKDDSLRRVTENDPVADARLAADAFTLEWDEFSRMVATGDPGPAVFRYCLQGTPGRREGLSRALEAMGARALSNEEAVVAVREMAVPFGCRAGVASLIAELGDGSTGRDARPALAYALAWLRVAGASSVLPHWVRHQFPEVAPLIRTLRDRPCSDPTCSYCPEMHDPVGQLRKFFDLPQFAPKPAGDGGGSLQEAIVRAGMGDEPLLAIVPTGGGKSIGYQLPAILRNLRRGALTVVISPLQALMKDQVDGFCSRTNSHLAAALHGMLTAPERAKVLSEVRLGDVALLYVSPEQLRNRTLHKALHNREIGCWVFDEAHCLSQWGHDFRPDYLYASRFIREFAKKQGVTPPPVACFTATAKRDVRDEILAHFRAELSQELRLFEAGVTRENLHFEVRLVDAAQKFQAVCDVVRDELAREGGSAIVYFATQKHTEEASDFLRREGLAAEHFHAGLEAPVKRRIQDDFIAGQLKIICATNAFGMGIDKSDVRLVVHAEVPGTVENYLQEAGRAGRDRKDARCVLLYSEKDVETQFRLGAMSQLGRHDIAAILRGIRKARRRDSTEVVITTGDLLRDEDAGTTFDAEDRNADTKVKTAISWLERAGFVERNDNHTRVFQGRPKVRSLDEAQKKIDAIRPPLVPAARERWMALLAALMNADPDEGLSADDLALLSDVQKTLSFGKGALPFGMTPGQLVIESLFAMTRAGLIQDGLLCTAFVRWKVADSSSARFKHLAALDAAMVATLREEHPDAEDGSWQSLSLRRLNQRLLDLGHSGNQDVLRRLLKSLEWDGRGMAGNRGSIDLRYVHRDEYQVRLHRSWSSLVEVAERRRAVAQATLEAIIGRIPRGQDPLADFLVSFSLGDIADALAKNLLLQIQVKDPLKAIEHGLTFLHEQKIIHLQHGLAVFRQAMTIQILPEAHGRTWTMGHQEPLAHHYRERIFQVHVMAEYARLGLDKVKQAIAFVAAYFTMEKSAFVGAYFSDREEVIERATTHASYVRIVEALGSPTQAAIVAAPPENNLLVLAGPGSGKTRIVVHRVAWLVRVKRVPPRAILVLAFNRSAALVVRRRLRALIDDDALFVTIQTYHGLALRLCGRSLSPGIDRVPGREAPPDFDALIEDAIRLLGEPKEGPDGETDPDEVRDRVLAGYSHILVDEYQDIDARQYRFISSLCGRTSRDANRKLSILAVGDDDQNIYSFRDANVEFIRRFETDYAARRSYLVENYRSTAHVVALSNQLIADNQDRMKTAHPIRIDKKRKAEPEGGAWAGRDALAQGRVQLLAVADRRTQAVALREEIERLRALDPTLDYSDIAVLSRHRADLDPIRVVLETSGIPVRFTVEREKMPPLFRIREVAALFDALHARRGALLDPAALRDLIRPDHSNAPDPHSDITEAAIQNPWQRLLFEIVASWSDEVSGTSQPARRFTEYAAEALTETRREQVLGRGVLLSTIHGAKGMEFPHVFIPDAGGPGDGKKGNIEEERRILYVAITRSQETLCLFQRKDARNPFLDKLLGPFLLRRTVDPPPAEALPSGRYELLDLSDLYVDYAALFVASHPIHAQLRALQPGDFVRLGDGGNAVGVFDRNGHQVGSLSKKASETWRPLLARIDGARVVAMIERRETDVGEGYTANCATWEVPVFEIYLRH